MADPTIFKKGDLVSGRDMESDCIGIVICLKDGIGPYKRQRVSVRWLHHWHLEMLDNEFTYSPSELRELGIEDEDR
jgi:hypothetical protein